MRPALSPDAPTKSLGKSDGRYSLRNDIAIGRSGH